MNQKNLFVVSLFISGLLSWAIWAWLGRDIILPDVPNGRLECLSYTPTIGDISPLDKDFVIPTNVLINDMERLKQITHCVRTYSSLRAEGEVVSVAARAGLKVLLGIWISNNPSQNEKEIKQALKLADLYPETVQALIVGNEVLLRCEMSAKKLANIIQSVKNRSRHPVTYADIFEFWRRYPIVAETVDYVTLHVLPYWDDPKPLSIDQVQDHVRDIINLAKQTFPNKQFKIGEIGWPSSGRTRGGAAPTLINSARFIREFAVAAPSIGLPYNLIEAVDQPWKRLPEGTVGGYWGVLDKERNQKFPLIGAVREWPHWEWGAGFSLIIASLILIWSLINLNNLTITRWILIAVTGTVIGTDLWALIDQLRLISLGTSGWLFGSYLLIIAIISSLFLIKLATGLTIYNKNSALPSLRTTLVSPSLLGLFRWTTLIPAAIVTLLLAIDGRHRDFLTLAYWLPALVLIFINHRDNSNNYSIRRDEAWLGLLFLIGGIATLEGLDNYEAIFWAGCTLILGLPLLPHTYNEIKRLIQLFKQ